MWTLFRLHLPGPPLVPVDTVPSVPGPPVRPGPTVAGSGGVAPADQVRGTRVRPRGLQGGGPLHRRLLLLHGLPHQVGVEADCW